VTVTVVCADAPPYEAVIVTACVELTTPTETANVADTEPSATETVAGTDTASRFDESATTAPPGGAGADSTIVPDILFPLATELCDNVRL
jgi:hypothetical protein